MIRDVLPGSGSWIIFTPFRIPAPDPGSAKLVSIVSVTFGSNILGQMAQKHADPQNPDPQHCFANVFENNYGPERAIWPDHGSSQRRVSPRRRRTGACHICRLGAGYSRSTRHCAPPPADARTTRTPGAAAHPPVTKRQLKLLEYFTARSTLGSHVGIFICWCPIGNRYKDALAPWAQPPLGANREY